MFAVVLRGLWRAALRDEAAMLPGPRQVMGLWRAADGARRAAAYAGPEGEDYERGCGWVGAAARLFGTEDGREGCCRSPGAAWRGSPGD